MKILPESCPPEEVLHTSPCNLHFSRRCNRSCGCLQTYFAFEMLTLVSHLQTVLILRVLSRKALSLTQKKTQTQMKAYRSLLSLTGFHCSWICSPGTCPCSWCFKPKILQVKNMYCLIPSRLNILTCNPNLDQPHWKVHWINIQFFLRLPSQSHLRNRCWQSWCKCCPRWSRPSFLQWSQFLGQNKGLGKLRTPQAGELRQGEWEEIWASWWRQSTLVGGSQPVFVTLAPMVNFLYLLELKQDFPDPTLRALWCQWYGKPDIYQNRKKELMTIAYEKTGQTSVTDL